MSLFTRFKKDLEQFIVFEASLKHFVTQHIRWTRQRFEADPITI